MNMTSTAFSYADVLPFGIRSRSIDNGNGLVMHVLEAGYESRDRPCVLLLHGFPELAYSWRKVMPALAGAGFHVVAPDQRGYGRTTGWDGRYDGDVAAFRLLNLVTDALGLVHALGRHSVTTVVGHDFGSAVAAHCALVRPDVFRSVVMMSAPYAGPAALPFDTANRAPQAQAAPNTKAQVAPYDIHAALAALARPRKHYQWYYSTREANGDMHDCPQGVHAFLRAYFHVKSADWEGNDPFALEAWTAAELAKLPTYYVMDLDRNMAQTVAPHMPSSENVAACNWLTEDDLAVYSAEYTRTGFQGGLQWYRCRTDPRYNADLRIFAGRTIDVPAAFISGRSDWGIHQTPGVLERMREHACTQMQDFHLLPGAGHWVQQEQAQETSRLLTAFVQQRVRQETERR